MVRSFLRTTTTHRQQTHSVFCSWLTPRLTSRLSKIAWHTGQQSTQLTIGTNPLLTACTSIKDTRGLSNRFSIHLFARNCRHLRNPHRQVITGLIQTPESCISTCAMAGLKSSSSRFPPLCRHSQQITLKHLNRGHQTGITQHAPVQWARTTFTVV